MLQVHHHTNIICAILFIYHTNQPVQSIPVNPTNTRQKKQTVSSSLLRIVSVWLMIDCIERMGDDCLSIELTYWRAMNNFLIWIFISRTTHHVAFEDLIVEEVSDFLSYFRCCYFLYLECLLRLALASDFPPFLRHRCRRIQNTPLTVVKAPINPSNATLYPPS